MNYRAQFHIYQIKLISQAIETKALAINEII